jgi:hypothetical protein
MAPRELRIFVGTFNFGNSPVRSAALCTCTRCDVSARVPTRRVARSSLTAAPTHAVQRGVLRTTQPPPP